MLLAAKVMIGMDEVEHGSVVSRFHSVGSQAGGSLYDS